MAGALCPNCGKRTFFTIANGKSCTKCGYTVVVPVNGGIGGRGKQCPICKRYTFFEGVCTNPACKAREKK